MTRLLCRDAARFIGLALQSATAMSGFIAVMFMFPLCAGQSWEVEIHPEREKYTFDVTQDNAVVFLQCSLGNTSSPSLEWYDGQGKIISDIYSGDSNPRRIVIRRRNYVELRFLAPETELNSGNYTCRGSGADGVVKEKTIQIILYKGIQLTSPTRQFALYGQDARLNCSSSASFPRETNLFFSNWTALAGARYRKENDYVIIANFSRADEGMYRCSIRLHEIGDSKNYELHLLAAVPPKFNGSMTFWPPEPKVGQNLKIMCDISAKPDPVYQFYKVEGNNTRIIQSNDVTNGRLLLKNLTQADDGEYKCVATNGWGSASQTISIDVLSPLTIRYARVDLNNELEGSEGRLECNVTGDPEPVVSWKRGNYYFHNQSKSEISGRIYTNTERETDKNKGFKSVVHTLIFRSLEASDMSTYTCEASNTFARVNSSVPLVVQFKPNFSKQMTTRFYSWRHINATLTCTAIGKPEPLLSWFYNGTKIENRGDLEIKTTVVEETSPIQVISTLKVSVSNGNNNRKLGNYTCKAENKHGHTEKQLELVEAYLPDAPEVTLVDLKPSSLGLSVKSPLDNGGLPIKKYNIEYTPKNNTVFTQKLDVSINPAEPFKTYVKLSGLQIKTTYMINVSAVTDVGRGLASCITASTLDVCEPDNVTIISDKAGNESQHYTLLWIPEYSGGCNVTGYNIEYAKGGVDANGSWTEVSPEQFINVTVTFPQSSHLLKNLEEDTYYQVKINAFTDMRQSKVTKFIFKTGLNKVISTSVLPSPGPISNAEVWNIRLPALIAIAVSVIVLALIAIIVGAILTRKARNKRHQAQMAAWIEQEVFPGAASDKIVLRGMSETNTKAENQELPEPLRKVFEGEKKTLSEEEAYCKLSSNKELHVCQNASVADEPESVQKTASKEHSVLTEGCLFQL